MIDPVVVGVSSSGTRLPMVRWAAGEAVGRGTRLRLVSAHAAERTDREAALRRLADIAAAVAASLPGLEVRTETVTGPPAAVLREAAADAALLVVGADDASPFTEALAGSVPGDLLTTAPCPLAVTPRREWTTPASAPVVVAMDGEDTGHTALAYAFAAAARTGRPLTVLSFPPVDTGPATHDDAHDDVLARLGASYPAVDVTTRPSLSDTAAALVAVSRTAAQLVLGADPRGSRASGRFSSARRTLIRGAGCPVVVSGRGGRDDRSLGRGSTGRSSSGSPPDVGGRCRAGR